MTFRMFFGWIKTCMVIAIALAGTAIVVLDAVMISGAVPAFETANVTVAAVSLAAAAQAIEVIRKTGLDKETVNTCFVLDAQRRLLGTVTLRRLVGPKCHTGNQDAVL